MQATTEFEIKVSGGQMEIPKDLPDGIYRQVTKVEEPEENPCRGFVRIPVSELSLEDDWFRKFEPKSLNEKSLYEEVEEIIKDGKVKDFYRPTMDPSFKERGTGICYVPGKKPATGEFNDWWSMIAIRLNPDCKSRLGTVSEYIAFLAVLIKRLVKSGWYVSDAWNAVCNNSKDLGHFADLEDTIIAPEKTGTKEVCGFYDLANTRKILAEDEDPNEFSFASGYWGVSIGWYSLYHITTPNPWHADSNRNHCTGWIVCEKDPT